MNLTLPSGLLSAVAATGAIAVGAVLIEAAIVPGLLIGAAAVLAPQLVSAQRRRAQPQAKATSLRDMLPKSIEDLAHIKMSQAVVKTVTYRAIVTTLDFTANYLVLQEPATAAGLSAISLVGGPLFYFTHEGIWNYLVGSGRIDLATRGPIARKLLENRPLVKTITFRTFASIIEFGTNYVVVRDLGTAALLTSFGFFLGPFVYYGHEWAWERYGTRRPEGDGTPPIIDAMPLERSFAPA